MADDVKYEYTSAQAIRGTENKVIAKWAKDGWEVDSRDQGLLRTELTFRRVKPTTLASRALAAFRRLEPKAQRGLVAASGALVLLVIGGSAIAGTQAGGSTTASASTEVAAEATPSQKASVPAAPAPKTTSPAEPTIASPAPLPAPVPEAPKSQAPAPVAPKPQAPAPIAPKPQALAPAPVPVPVPAPVAPAPEPPASAGPFKNCDAARAAGAAPVRRGDSGYASHLDRDGDGVGCEN